MLAIVISVMLFVGAPDLAPEKLKAPVLEAGQFTREVFAYLKEASGHAVRLKADNITPKTWEAESNKYRQRILDEVVFRGEAKKWRELPLKVEHLDDTLGGPGYRIRKLRFEAVPGLWIPALLYEPTEMKGRVPGVLNTNGHDIKGFQAPYKQINCINQVKRGMIAINVDWIGYGQLTGPGFQHDQMNKIDLCGTSGLAVFYLAMSRALDILSTHPHIDPKRIAMTGLSGGGWQTILLSSLDPRITLVNPVAGYSSFSTRADHPGEIGDSEQVPPGLGAVADYMDLTALLAPRATLLTYCQKDDCCFQAPHALPPLVNHVKPIFEKLGQGNRLQTHINYDPGTHNYQQDNREAFYRFVGANFFPDDPTFDGKEIPSDDEVKSASEIRVPLPTPNADFISLAKKLSIQLTPAWRGKLDPESDRPNVFAEHLAGRVVLGEPKVLESIEMTTAIFSKGSSFPDVAEGTCRRGYLPSRWSVLDVVPVIKEEELLTDGPSIPFVDIIDISQNQGVDVTIIVSDRGKANMEQTVNRLKPKRHRIIMIDLVGFGECTFPTPYINSFIDTFSSNPLPIQSAQLFEVIRYIQKDAPGRAINIVAEGPRSSTIAIITVAALPKYGFGTLELSQPLASLRQLIDDPASVHTRPELFRAGLLAHMDISDAVSNLLVKRLVIRDATSHVVEEFGTMGLVFDKRKSVQTELVFE